MKKRIFTILGCFAVIMSSITLMGCDKDEENKDVDNLKHEIVGTWKSDNIQSGKLAFNSDKTGSVKVGTDVNEVKYTFKYKIEDSKDELTIDIDKFYMAGKEMPTIGIAKQRILKYVIKNNELTFPSDDGFATIGVISCEGTFTRQ